ncbi:hypothetical protein Tco_1390565, partial [Tanacetum coccineum]
AKAAPDNMNGWVEEEEDPEMEEEEEDPEEDPEMEEEEEEMNADEEWDGPEWILPYQGVDPLYPSPPASDFESEIKFEEAEVEAEAEAEVAPILPLVLANLVPEAATVGTSRLTPLKSDLDALHHRVQHIKDDDVHAENKQLRMLRWSIMVENLLPPRLQYQEPPYALAETLLATVTHNDPKDPYVAARDAATAPAIDNDDSLTQKETMI